MTEKEFYEVLRGLKYSSYIGVLGRIRLISEENVSYCPITAVAMDQTKVFFATYAHRTAASLLGLEKEFAEEVVSGSDGRSIKSSETRAMIIEALGMESE